MFGLPSISKLLVLVGAILIVWYGFKLLTRLENARKAKSGPELKQELKAQGDGLETVKCSVCGIFLATDVLSNCGREGCPY